MTVQEFYETIHGDYAKAQALLMNDDFIKKFLLKYLDNDLCQKTIEAYNNKNMHEVFEKAHGLKGVAGNLSLTPIFEITAKICDKTRNLQEGEIVLLDDEMAALEKTHNQVIEAIKEL